MNKTSFTSELLQNLGFISAIAVAISQYAFNDTFKFLFYGIENLYIASSLAALIFSIGIILGIYAYRFSLLNKIYFDSSKRDKYFEYLKWVNTPLEQRSSRNRTPVKEPWSITVLFLSFIFIIISFISFALFVVVSIPIFKVLLYILFICLTVGSISIFSIQLYRDSEFRRLQQINNDIVMNKIRERFVENIKIIVDSGGQFSQGPDRTIVFEYNGVRYRVFTKSYDPNSYFLLEEFPEVTSVDQNNPA